MLGSLCLKRTRNTLLQRKVFKNASTAAFVLKSLYTNKLRAYLNTIYFLRSPGQVLKRFEPDFVVTSLKRLVVIRN